MTNVIRFAGVLVGVALAGSAKESGLVVLPLLLLVAWHQRRLTWDVGLVVGVGVGLVLPMLPTVWAIGGTPGHPVTQLSIASWLGLQSCGVWRMLSLEVWPWGLSIEHDYQHVADGWRSVAIGGLLALTLVSVYVASRWRLVALGLAWLLIAVGPRLLIRTPVSTLTEHQWYGSHLGVALLVAAIVAAYRTRRTA